MVKCEQSYLKILEKIMSNTSLGESGVNYYLDTLCEMGDHGFQFAYSCVLERSAAFDLVSKSYENLADNLPAPGDGDSDIIPVVAQIWKNIDQSGNYKSTKNENKVFSQLFEGLSLIERAVLCLKDYLGLERSDIAKILSKSPDEIEVSLAKGRQKLVEAKF